jgi:hypothetical protein
MRRICSLCNKEIGDIEPLEKDDVIYQVCENCLEAKITNKMALKSIFIGFGTEEGYGICCKR